MVSPIEKNPLFHYYAGSHWLSMESFGCNIKCPVCQNWVIAHVKPEEGERHIRYCSPEEVI
jgi:pyruvate formate lyase activating enzyme